MAITPNGVISIFSRLKRHSVFFVVLALLSGVVVSVWTKWATDQRVCYVLYGDASFAECDRLWENRQYGRLVELMEEQCNRFDATMAELGGLEKFIIKRGRAKEDMGHGMSDLDWYPGVVNHNDRYIPMPVHMFVKGVAVSGNYSPGMVDVPAESLELANHMSRSKHPMLKAYGLWILKHREELVNQPGKSSDFSDVENHPAIEAYRLYAYEHAAMGESWAFGFAADATRSDPDVPRALGFLENFETMMTTNSKDEVYAYWLPSADRFFCEIVCGMAERSKEDFKKLDGRQTAFLNRILDRALRTEDAYLDSNMQRLFHIMNRQTDVPVYEARVKAEVERRNHGR